MVESGIKIPSDLCGITLPFFPSTKKNRGLAASDSEQKKKVSECCMQIENHIAGRNQIFDFGFLPSTSLAYGYFNNFILKAVSNLLESKFLKLATVANVKHANKNTELSQKAYRLNGINFSDLSFTILIPDQLSANMFDHSKAHRLNGGWDLIKIDAGGFRPFDFYIHAKDSRGGSLRLSDIPITLNALGESIRAYVGKSHIGPSQMEKLLENKELRMFKRVLDYLIAENPITAKRVKTKIVTSEYRRDSGR